MKVRIARLAMLCLVALVGVSLPLIPAAAERPQDVDHKAVVKTHVHHLRMSLAQGGGTEAGQAAPAAAASFGGTAYQVGATVSPANTIPEAEEHIALDPQSTGAKLVAAISDFSLRGGFNTTKWAVSSNGGTSWREAFVPLSGGAPATSDGRTWDANSDPVVAIDRLGNVYIADLYLSGTTNANGLYVSIANVGTLITGGSFLQQDTVPVAVNASPSTTTSEDKEWIAVDDSATSSFSGRVYVSWTRFVGNSDLILVSHSGDHGRTWSTPVQVSSVSQNGGVQGSQIAVGPDGTVYVVYEVFFVGGSRRQYLTKSTNGGASFSTPAAASPLFNEVNFSSTYRKNSFPALAVSAQNAHVYVVYSDQRSRKNAEVEFITSANGGASFSAPVTINNVSTGQQFMPAVTVDSAGVIHASWFDTRNSTKGAANYDIYATYSRDNGTTFAPNARVTGSIINAGSASFIGDYSGIAADAGKAHPVWTSGGFNNGKLQTATLTLP